MSGARAFVAGAVYYCCCGHPLRTCTYEAHVEALADHCFPRCLAFVRDADGRGRRCG